MRLLSFLSCGSHGTSQVSLAIPELRAHSQLDPITSVDTTPVQRVYRINSSPANFSRPREDTIQKPKRSRSLPINFEPGGGSNILSSWLKIATGREVQPDPKLSLTSTKMEVLSNPICNIIDDHVENDDPPWLWRTFVLGLLKNQNVEAALQEAKKENPGWKNSTSCLTAFVQNHAPQLFAMLVYMKNIKLLDQFCEKGMGDVMFPVRLLEKNKSIESTKGDQPIKLEFGSQLNVRDAKTLFGDWQWQFFAPELRWRPFESPAFDSKCKLPFLTPLLEISRTEFSIVYTAVVHRDYIDVESNGLEIATKSINGEQHPCVAVKLLLPTGLKKEDSESFIKAEYQTLEILRDFDTQHLIKATAFYKMKSREVELLYFVFPFAEQGNLRKFWQQTKPSICEKSHMTWVFEQLRGLADAIKTLHHEKEETCRHGDLKPENVLCFKVSGSTAVEDLTSCILVISDVGLSRIHDKSTQLRSKSKMAAGETVAYAAPEAELFPERATTRRYDIWSLGCLYLEFIIWLLYGAEELERFGEERDRYGERNGARFYIITSPETLTVNRSRTPVVNPAVKKWIEHIKQDPRCVGTGSGDTAIGRLVSLIEKRLLVVTASPDSKDPLPPSEKLAADNLAIAASGEDVNANPKFLVVQATATDLNRASQPAPFTVTGEKERAYAIEVSEKLDKIIQDVGKRAIHWLNHQAGTENVQYKGPEFETDLTLRGRTGSVSKDPDYKFPKLDDNWEYVPDQDAAQRLEATLKHLPQQNELSKLCGRCCDLSLWSQDCSFDDTPKKLARRSVECVLCRLLSRSLMNRNTLPDDNLHFFRDGSSLKFNNKLLPPIIPLYTLPEASETLKSNIQLGFPQLPDPGSQTHIEVLRQWILDCDQKHQCLHSQDTPFLPTRLIYVGKNGSERARLVCQTESLEKETKYLALSHRWGTPPKEGQPNSLEGKIVCTYKNNIDRLSHGFDDSELPPMYLDAILIARELGIEYLWIDSLCIIQKDTEDWKEESELMEQVFRSAYATLAATCAGTPTERFLKLRPERQCVTMKADNAFYYLCDAIDDFSREVEQGELNKRGWVFQERALSRRTIYFAEKQTYWECGKGVRCETLTKTSNSKASFLGDANFPYSMPSYVRGQQIVLFQDLYQRYSKLALTVDTDRPVAIRGLEIRLLRVLQTKGKFGVFEIYLRRSLLWQRDQATLKRIDFSSKKEQEVVPSWSWMAYNGEIRYTNVPFGEVEWDLWDQEITSPWKQIKEDSEAPLELEVIVRDLKAIPPGSRVFLDEPSLNDGRSFKCVIVGSSKESSQGKGQVYYALIVTPVGQGDTKVYERAGVASMHKHHIVLDKPGTKARLR